MREGGEKEKFWEKARKSLNVPFKGIYPDGWNKILQHISRLLCISLLSIFFMAENVSAEFVQIPV